MQKILVSACLMGCKVRYHGGDALCHHNLLEIWENEGRLIKICPEVSAGLSVPRTPSEIIGNGGGISVLAGYAKVVSHDGVDKTDEFLAGANYALKLAEENNIKIAILKANSPSCGNKRIYDGSYSGNLIFGMGTTAALLTQHGIKVFNETEINEVQEYLLMLEKTNQEN